MMCRKKQLEFMKVGKTETRNFNVYFDNIHVKFSLFKIT